MTTEDLPFSNTPLPCCNRRAHVRNRSNGAQVKATCECGGRPKTFAGTVTVSPTGYRLRIDWTRLK